MTVRIALTTTIAAICAFTLSSCSDSSDAPSASPTTGTTATAGSWTMLGHDGRSNFHNADETAIGVDTATDLARAWEIEVAGSVNGAPAIVDDIVYVLATGATYALEASTGEELWRNADIKGTSSVTYDDGRLYINDSRSVLHRLDANTGVEDWQARIDDHPNAGGFSSPVVAGSLVLVGSASIEEVAAKENATFRGALVAFDTATGAEVWRHYTVDPPENGVSIWSSPSVDLELDLVFGTTGNNYTEIAGATSDSIFALSLETGELRWNRQVSTGDVFTVPSPRSPDSDFGTNPILFEAAIDGRERKLVGAGQKSGAFWALDRETGEIVWSRKVSPGSALIGGIFNNGAFDGERLIVAGNNGASTAPGSEPADGTSKTLGAADTPTAVLMALDPTTGDILWERQLPAWVWAPITLANGVGFVAANTQLQAFDTATGKKLAVWPTAGTISSGAAISNGRVFFGSGLGYLGTTRDNKLHALAVP